jgi:hypothetical protein
MKNGKRKGKKTTKNDVGGPEGGRERGGGGARGADELPRESGRAATTPTDGRTNRAKLTHNRSTVGGSGPSAGGTVFSTRPTARGRTTSKTTAAIRWEVEVVEGILCSVNLLRYLNISYRCCNRYDSAEKIRG